MAHDVFKNLMMGYLDGELTALEEARMEQHLRECADCSGELESFRKLKEITKPMKLAVPDEAYWEQYWSRVYNRLERQFGWALFSVGAILLASYGSYTLVNSLLLDREMPAVMRIGTAALIIGVCTLLVSVVRERIHAWRSDKYKRIKQ